MVCQWKVNIRPCPFNQLKSCFNQLNQIEFHKLFHDFLFLYHDSPCGSSNFPVIRGERWSHDKNHQWSGTILDHTVKAPYDIHIDHKTPRWLEIIGDDRRWFLFFCWHRRWSTIVPDRPRNGRNHVLVYRKHPRLFLSSVYQ